MLNKHDTLLFSFSNIKVLLKLTLFFKHTNELSPIFSFFLIIIIIKNPIYSLYLFKKKDYVQMVNHFINQWTS